MTGRSALPQPPGSKICGQIAVAAVTGESVERVIEIIGHDRGTKTVELQRALRALGWECPDKCMQVSAFPTPPELAIAIVRPVWRRTGNWHWIVTEWGEPIQNNEVPECMHITSYLPVRKVTP